MHSTVYDAWRNIGSIPYLFTSGSYLDIQRADRHKRTALMQTTKYMPPDWECATHIERKSLAGRLSAYTDLQAILKVFVQLEKITI
jgi:hypothetical protein